MWDYLYEVKICNKSCFILPRQLWIRPRHSWPPCWTVSIPSFSPLLRLWRTGAQHQIFSLPRELSKLITWLYYWGIIKKWVHDLSYIRFQKSSSLRKILEGCGNMLGYLSANSFPKVEENCEYFLYRGSPMWKVVIAWCPPRNFLILTQAHKAVFS